MEPNQEVENDSAMHFLQFTRRRLQDLRMKQTLQQIVLQYIVKCIYSNEPSQRYIFHGLKVLDQQQDEDLFIKHCQARDDILQQLMKLKCQKGDGDVAKFNVLVTAIWRLLHVTTRKLNFINLLSFYPSHEYRSQAAVDLINAAGVSCKNATELSISSFNFEADDLDKDMRPLRSLGKLKQLRKLAFFDGQPCINFRQLLKLCYDYLPELEVLRVQLVPPSESDYQKLHTDLRNLRVLVNSYSVDHCESDSLVIDAWGPLFAKYYPKIDYYLYTSEDDIGMDFNTDSPDRNFLQVNRLEAVWETHCELLLRKYPKITELLVDARHAGKDNFQDTNPLLKFPKVRMLSLECTNSKTVCNLFLSSLGMRLQKLYLDALCRKKQLCPLSRILKFCPQLDTLNLSYNHSEGNAEILEIGNMLRLRNLKLTVITGKMIVSQILRAPNLQRVSLNGPLDKNDLDIVTGKIIKGHILGQLESFHVELLHRFPVGANQGQPRYTIDSIETASFFLKLAVTYLPKLTDLRVTLLSFRYLDVATSNGDLPDIEDDLTQAQVDDLYQRLRGDPELVEIMREFNKYNNFSGY